jgi:hypothetical protein
LRGIAYAQEHPDEAVQAVLTYTGPETDPEHMHFMLEAELPDATSAATDQYGLGWQTSEQWQALADMLETYEILPRVDVSGAFTNHILELARPDD